VKIVKEAALQELKKTETKKRNAASNPRQPHSKKMWL
jgi:hypothetical protein